MGDRIFCYYYKLFEVKYLSFIIIGASRIKPKTFVGILD